MNIANADGATVRADMNAAFQALAENSSGATAPSTTFSYQNWADTANDLMKIRNAANSAWIVLFKLSTAGMVVGADIASASALPVLADGQFNDVTGTTGITSINTLGIGTIKWLQFDGALTISHHSTNLVLPDGRDILTVAGDILCFYEYATADWRLISNTSNATPFRKGADISTNSAGNLTLSSNHNAYDVTGTDAVTSIDAVAVGTTVILQFDSISTVTHHATNLILPNATNITTVAGQILTFHEYATGDWRLVSNSVSGGAGTAVLGSTADNTVRKFMLNITGDSGSGGIKCSLGITNRGFNINAVGVETQTAAFTKGNSDTVSSGGTEITYALNAGGTTLTVTFTVGSANTLSSSIADVGGLAAITHVKTADDGTNFTCQLFNSSGAAIDMTTIANADNVSCMIAIIQGGAD